MTQLRVWAKSLMLRPGIGAASFAPNAVAFTLHLERAVSETPTRRPAAVIQALRSFGAKQDGRAFPA